MDVFYLVVQDWWYVPDGGAWLDILTEIGCFRADGDLCSDNELKDCFCFFEKAAEMLGFAKEFAQKFASLPH